MHLCSLPEEVLGLVVLGWVGGRYMRMRVCELRGV